MNFFRAEEIYDITLVKGHHFHDIGDYETLYETFCFLSYMTDICKITINDRFFFQ